MLGNEKYGFSPSEEVKWEENVLSKAEDQDSWEMKDVSDLDSLASKEEDKVNTETNEALSWLIGDIETPSNSNKEDPDWTFGMHEVNEKMAYIPLDVIS